MTKSLSPWVVILAGGDGRRLDGAIIDGRRLDRPKQFCCFRDETLLQHVLRRARRITEPERTIVVVRDQHWDWWQRELQQLPSQNVLSEAANRGTAVAILNATFHVLQRDRNPVLLFLPSDHSADDEDALVESASSAARLVTAIPEHLILLGITPDSPETEYGWILPGKDDPGAGRIVERFVEKPPAGLALELHAAGGLWNSFIFASSGHQLLKLFEATQPRLVSGYLKWFFGQESSEPRTRDRFLALPSVDFCRDVLPSAATRLRVLVAPPCGWTDLGTPLRVNEWLKRIRAFPSSVPEARHAGATHNQNENSDHDSVVKEGAL